MVKILIFINFLLLKFPDIFRLFFEQKTEEIHIKKSYPEASTVKKLVKRRFFTLTIYYISSENHRNITLLPKYYIPKITLAVIGTCFCTCHHNYIICYMVEKRIWNQFII